MVELVHGESRVSLSETRGGIVTRFDVGDRAVLFLDESTLADPTKNVRGGIPVLFPSPGKLTGDHWKWGSYEGQQPQHGFARNEPWQIVERDAHAVTLRLEQAASPAWPWPCSLEIRYVLGDHTLRLEPRVTNHGSTDMPFGLGFHPYFAVDQKDKAALRIPTAATGGYDNVRKQSVPLTGPIDLTVPEVDLHLVDHGGSHAQLIWSNGRTLRIDACPDLDRWVIWTLKDRDFVCLEPWSCPGDALNTGEQLIVLSPGETRALWLAISPSEA